MQRLTFEDGAVWRSNPPEGEETDWKASEGYVMPFYGELWKSKCDLARLNHIAGDDPRAEPYRSELEGFVQDFSDAIQSNAPALQARTALTRAHLDRLPGARSANIVYAYKSKDELNPLDSFRMSKRFAENQWHQDVADGKIDPLADFKRRDIIIGAIALAVIAALWYVGILGMVPEPVWWLIFVAYVGFVALRFIGRMLGKYQIVIRERPTT